MMGFGCLGQVPVLLVSVKNSLSYSQGAYFSHTFVLGKLRENTGLQFIKHPP